MHPAPGYGAMLPQLAFDESRRFERIEKQHPPVESGGLKRLRLQRQVVPLPGVCLVEKVARLDVAQIVAISRGGIRREPGRQAGRQAGTVRISAGEKLSATGSSRHSLSAATSFPASFAPLGVAKSSKPPSMPLHMVMVNAPWLVVLTRATVVVPASSAQAIRLRLISRG
ncbi:MAG: hypothetical protein HGB15_06275 [Chlorobaculum sp.]|nr:hypothetical protein [Chlorobaculum sp.]